MADGLIQCPHCQGSVFRKSAGGRLKAKTRIVVLHKSGAVELNCGNCRQPIILPVVFVSDNDHTLRKARLTVRRDLTG